MSRSVAIVMFAALVACGPSTPPVAPVIAGAPPPASEPPPANAPPPAPTTQPQVTDAQAAELARQAEQMQMAMLGSGGGGRPATSSSAQPIPPVDLSGASATPPKPVGPQADVHSGGSTATNPIANADRVIAGLRPRFRHCYQAALNSDPTMSGKLVVTARVGPNGEVSSASIVSNSGMSQAAVACVTGFLKRAQFDPPGGGGSTLSVPLVFVTK